MKGSGAKVLDNSSGRKDFWRIAKHAQRKYDKKKLIGSVYDASGELLKDDDREK